MGNFNRSSAIKNILDLIDRIHTGNHHFLNRKNFQKTGNFLIQKYLKLIFLNIHLKVVVLIKCIAPLYFWLVKNPIPIPANNPLALPRILGIEIPNHPIYDLFLLLVVFFHRFVQKQMGIWKTGYSDEEYAVQPIDPNAVKSTIVNERENGSTQALAKPEIDENGEHDKLVQFEKTQEESSAAQNYFSNVSAIS